MKYLVFAALLYVVAFFAAGPVIAWWFGRIPR